MISRSLIMILIILAACGCCKVAGQNISGQVTDDMTGKPIQGVSLSLKGTTQGTASDAGGHFRLEVKNMPAVLVVSHLSYKSKEVTVRTTAGDLNISLEPYSHDLRGIDIKPFPVAEVVKERSFDVLDYEFLGDDILLLANRNGSMFRPCLVMVNLQGDTLSTYDVSRPDRLYRDYDGEICFISHQSAFHVYSDDSAIVLSYITDRDEFFGTYPYVVARRSPDWVLKNYYHMKQELDYFLYSENDEKCHLFCSIVNEPAIARAGWGPYFDGKEADEHFARVIINRPVFAPMFRDGDSLLLFNYYERKIAFYDDHGAELGSVPASFMHQKDCKEEIYKDEITGKYYVLFQKNGVSTLNLIDLKNGNTMGSAKIPGFVFVEKIIVHNDEVFFLYREKTDHGAKRMYRMKI